MDVDAAPDLEAFGVLVRDRRRQLGLTQTELAGRVGWVQERISLIEHGKYGLPSLPALSRLARALQIPLSDLLETLGYHELREGTTPSSLSNTLQRLLAIDDDSLQGALTQAADILLAPLHAEKIDLFRVDATGQGLVAMGTSRTPLGERQRQLGLDRLAIQDGGRVAQVFKTREPFLTGHTDDDPEEVPGIRKDLGIRSTLAVPLMVAGGVMGVLSATSTRPDVFTSDDIGFLQAVSGWVALMMQRVEQTSDSGADPLERPATETRRQ